VGSGVEAGHGGVEVVARAGAGFLERFQTVAGHWMVLRWGEEGGMKIKKGVSSCMMALHLIRQLRRRFHEVQLLH
jgi:hypothetical protein